MAYRTLYRTYRPTRFEEVVGQKHITDTLKNQVATAHTAHAYLFCGTRGTGKTTTARIFARAVNCLSPENGEPCGKCAACQAMASGYNPDIIEIDAASNNGVDNVRDLIEQVQYATLQLKTRVLIIDEVHMLSSSAFNALLKTLEEPPEHTLFILATTEPQKLLATILSRCQRYDFHHLSSADIIGYLKDVLGKCGASIEEDGLRLIARCADGSMRDALSLTDQCLAFRGDTLTTADVYDVLGSMDSAFLDRVSEAILTGDAAKAVSMVDEIVTAGRDLTTFCRDLSQHMRALLLAKTCGRCEDLLDCAPDRMDRYLELVKNTSESRLLLSMEILLKAQSDMRYLTYPRNALECAMIRLCRPEDTLSLTALEARVARLEQGGFAGGANPTPTVGMQSNANAQGTQSTFAGGANPTPTVGIQSSANAQGTQSAFAGGASAAPTVGIQSSANAQGTQSAFAGGANPAPTADTQSGAYARGTQNAFAGGASPAPTVGVQSSANTQGTQSGAASWSADILFSAFLTELRKQNILLYGLFSAARAMDLNNEVLTVMLPEKASSAYQALTAPVNRDKLNKLIATIRPGTGLSLVKGTPPRVSEASVDRAKELFGDSLTVIG